MNSKKKVTVYLTPEILEMCDADARMVNIPSRNLYITQALQFYHGYLHKETTTDVLTPAFETVFNARIDMTEDRLMQLLNRLAVEQGAIMNVLAKAYKLNNETVGALKHRVFQEMKTKKNPITLEDAVHYQSDD